jgi:hypothetical protein
MSGQSVHQDFALSPVDRLIPRQAFQGSQKNTTLFGPRALTIQSSGVELLAIAATGMRYFLFSRDQTR